MIWIAMRPRMKPDMLGFIPGMLSENDPRPAREQLHENYQHGGGWRPFQGFTMLPSGDLKYPGDPPTKLLYMSQLRHETILFYEHDWLAIKQPDGTYEVCRMD